MVCFCFFLASKPFVDPFQVGEILCSDDWTNAICETNTKTNTEEDVRYSQSRGYSEQMDPCVKLGLHTPDFSSIPLDFDGPARLECVALIQQTSDPR